MSVYDLSPEAEQRRHDNQQRAQDWASETSSLRHQQGAYPPTPGPMPTPDLRQLDRDIAMARLEGRSLTSHGSTTDHRPSMTPTVISYPSSGPGPMPFPDDLREAQSARFTASSHGRAASSVSGSSVSTSERPRYPPHAYELPAGSYYGHPIEGAPGSQHQPLSAASRSHAARSTSSRSPSSSASSVRSGRSGKSSSSTSTAATLQGAQYVVPRSPSSSSVGSLGAYTMPMHAAGPPPAPMMGAHPGYAVPSPGLVYGPLTQGYTPAQAVALQASNVSVNTGHTRVQGPAGSFQVITGNVDSVLITPQDGSPKQFVIGHRKAKKLGIENPDRSPVHGIILPSGAHPPLLGYTGYVRSFLVFSLLTFSLGLVYFVQPTTQLQATGRSNGSLRAVVTTPNVSPIYPSPLGTQVYPQQPLATTAQGQGYFPPQAHPGAALPVSTGYPAASTNAGASPARGSGSSICSSRSGSEGPSDNTSYALGRDPATYPESLNGFADMSLNSKEKKKDSVLKKVFGKK